MKIMTFIKAGKRFPFLRKMAFFIFSSDISPDATIDKNTTFCHNGLGVIIGGNTIIERGCTIHPFTLFGNKNGGYPSIGENSIVYPHTIIVGKIKIGKNCVIGANSFVDKDVQDNSIVHTKVELLIKKRV